MRIEHAMENIRANIEKVEATAYERGLREGIRHEKNRKQREEFLKSVALHPKAVTTNIKCLMCNNTGFKDHAGFAVDPCECMDVRVKPAKTYSVFPMQQGVVGTSGFLTKQDREAEVVRVMNEAAGGALYKTIDDVRNAADGVVATPWGLVRNGGFVAT